jgi:hypothetical protein
VPIEKSLSRFEFLCGEGGTMAPRRGAWRALLTKEMRKEHAHINGGGCNKLATCLFFSFSLREWPRSENQFLKKTIWCAFSPFFSFFIFEHFSPKKWKKNTRTSMLAAVTTLPRVRLHLLFI